MQPKSCGLGALAQGVDGRREDVARATLCADERRLVFRGRNLLAQPRYLDIDRAVVDLVVMQARQADELAARKQALRRGKEGGEQVELVVREMHRPALRREEAAQAYIELPAREAGASEPLQ